jgi:hypothetical protein
MHRFLMIVATATVMASVPAAQQQSKKAAHPDFSGTWVVDGEKTNAANGRAAGTGRAGAPITVKQDALTLKIINVNGVERETYSLDGKDVSHKVAELTTGGPNPRMNPPIPGSTEIYKTTWEGEKLVTTMTGRGANGPSMLTETRYLEGQWMVVTNVRKTPTGDVTTTLYFKRVPN